MEIDPVKVGPVAEWFTRIEGAEDPPTSALKVPMPIDPGPLTEGVSAKHNQLSQNAVEFLKDMVRGMTDSGDILKQVLDQFQEVDLSSAKSLENLYTQPRWTPPTGQEGGG